VAAGVAGAAVNQTTDPIQHVVVIMEENHTFDNYFGNFPGVGAQYAQSLPAASNPAPHDIDHSGPRTRFAIDGGAMDGFDPLGELPWFARSRSVRTLVISPAPDAPTLETPPDVIGECVRDGRVLHVFVSIGPSARALRVAGEAAASESRCPFLCMADLEPRPAARAPLTTRIREARG